MAIRCEAIVEKGLLRPLADLGLHDAERVTLTVDRRTTAAPPQTAMECLLAAGIAHLSIEDASSLGGCDVAAVGLDHVNRTLPLQIRGKPLSATVIEERREGW